MFPRDGPGEVKVSVSGNWEEGGSVIILELVLASVGVCLGMDWDVL